MPLCPDCDHEVSKHGLGGCTHERGDAYQAGFAPMALGPCGCRAELYPGQNYFHATNPNIKATEQRWIDAEWDRILGVWLGRSKT